MADPAPSGARKWLFPLLIALLAVLLLIWLLDPAGDEDTGTVEDPIVTGEVAQPALDNPQPLDNAEPGTTTAPAEEPGAIATTAPATPAPAGTPTQ